MVNTRVLEQRLRWLQPRDGDDDAGSDAGGVTDDGRTVPLPEARSMAHAPLLQGRIETAGGTVEKLRAARDDDVSRAWEALPKGAESIDQLRARRGALHSIDRRSDAAPALDRLRARLLPALQEHGWTRIGICAPRLGGGATFVAAGLAASIARLQDRRVLLADMDLAAPTLARRFELGAPSGLAALIAGDVPLDAALCRIGSNLALLMQDQPVDDAGAVAQSRALKGTLHRLIDTLAPDALIMDMPPLLESEVSTALLDHLDAVLVVADGTRTLPRDITECEALLDGRVPLLGVVLNKSEDAGGHSGRG